MFLALPSFAAGTIRRGLRDRLNSSCLLVLGVLLIASTASGADVAGIQYGCWTLAASPYIVTDEIVVPAGKRLEIEAGVVVQFTGDHGLTVAGTLLAAGSAKNPVIFTVPGDRVGAGLAPGFEAEPGAWKGIEFLNSTNAASKLAYCIIRFAAYPVVLRNGEQTSLEEISISECVRNYVLRIEQEVSADSPVAAGTPQLASKVGAPDPAAEEVSRSDSAAAIAEQPVEPEMATRSENESGAAQEIDELLNNIAVQVMVRADAGLAAQQELHDKSYLDALADELRSAPHSRRTEPALDPESTTGFILEQFEDGLKRNEVSAELVRRYRDSVAGEPAPPEQPAAPVEVPDSPAPRDTTAVATARPRIEVQGVFRGEVGFQQRTGGGYQALLDLKHVALTLKYTLSPAAAVNGLSFFSEYAPVPELPLHQLDSAPLTALGILEPLAAPAVAMQYSGASGEAIPLQRLNVRISNVAGTGIDATFGQIRTPFGFWDDPTSHRNATHSKNNMLVLGFGLRKIELGLQVQRTFADGISVTGAVVSGRLGRTSNLRRVDHDGEKDFVGRVAWSSGRYSVGGSAYASGFQITRQFALGMDWAIETDRLRFAGEMVYQRNERPQRLYTGIAGLRNLTSSASYITLDYQLNRKLRAYLLYEIWSLTANGSRLGNRAYRAFHGIRYKVSDTLRWTVLELGNFTHAGFDAGQLHVASHFAITIH